MGGYFSKKNETKEEFGTHSHQIKVPAERRTVYRPDIFVDFYQSNLFKDADGSEANEFFVQAGSGNTYKVKRSRLKPVGLKEYAWPMLALTCPMVVCDEESINLYLKRKFNFVDRYPSDYIFDK